jgi:two-component system phosphate regulon sensor histidine kinase PhoR
VAWAIVSKANLTPMIPWILAGAAGLTAVLLARAFIEHRTRLRSAEHRIKRLEQEHRTQLAAQHQLRDDLLKAVDDVLLVLDSDHKIVFANPAAEAFLGPDLSGKTLLAAIRHSELDTLIADAQKLSAESVERRIDYERHILHVRAIASDRQYQTYYILALRDVTEIQRLERARREMVTNITHELSTPITSIGLLADTLLTLVLKEKPKRARKLVRDIRQEVDTLTQLVQEIRDLSLIESGQMPVRLTTTRLSDLVLSSVEALQALAENKEQTIALTVPENLFVLTDDLQIQRAIKNILHNAIKFSPQGGQIAVSATANEGEAILSVHDSGPGIPADDLPRVFERFFQVDRAREEGTGLGLAIVRHIVQAHGGRTWAESTEGQGATFFIALALAEPELD